jgi:hypothetical protein
VVQGQPGQIVLERLYLKNTQQVGEHLPSKHEALIQTPVQQKKKKKKTAIELHD